LELSLQEISKILDTHFYGNDKIPIEGVSIDTRTLKPGMLFFALSGEHSDGHNFVDQAFKQGACGAVVKPDSSTFKENNRLFKVDEPLKALQDIATVYRKKFEFPVIAVTGSNGKTTTKEMISSILETQFRVNKTPGNLNNHIGVALSICSFSSHDEIAVLEMGTNHFGEIFRLCEIANPTCGLITNIGKGHLEFFKDLSGVARAKSEILHFLGKEGIAFLNGDDPYLITKRQSVNKSIMFGFSEECDIQGKEASINSSGFPEMKVDGELIQLSFPGIHNLYNALAAIAIGRWFSITIKEIAEVLRIFKPIGKRMNMIQLHGMFVIDDTYNANPSSVYEAIQTLTDLLNVKRRIVVLGDMLELGISSYSEHKKIGDILAELNIDAFFGFGKECKIATKYAKNAGMKDSYHFNNLSDLVSALKLWVREGDGILVKGSRGMKMEEVVDMLKKDFSDNFQE
jgi:UDP-N-acetylmuramoyl-tripeptide--D-alanyl-D-alanine ligase